MAGVEHFQDAEQLGDKQTAQDTESPENSNLSSDKITDDSTIREQEEMTRAKCADGKQLQVSKFVLDVRLLNNFRANETWSSLISPHF